MIRRILTFTALFALGLTAGIAGAQQAGVLGYYAFDFAYSIPSQQANTYTFSPYSVCNQTASGTQFFPFATNAPVYIQDITAANSERLTPSAITKTSFSCGVTIAPTNSHYSFRVVSGTAGLQEALNTLAVSTLVYPRVIFIDARWKSQITAMGLVPATVLGQVTGNTKAVLIDLTAYTSGRWTSYTWSGSAYVAG